MNIIASIITKSMMLCFIGALPFSVAIAGILSSRFGPAIIFPISAIMMIGDSAFGWFQKEIREL
ncbi:MAG: hypothetical protein ACXVCM_17670 [Ktedonobacteraceae bacterium]